MERPLLRPTLTTHSPARPHWHSHWAAVYERLPTLPRLVLLASLLELAARVAMVAARAWIAMGIRCCSRAMYLSLAIDTFASEERLDISFISRAPRGGPAIDTA